MLVAFPPYYFCLYKKIMWVMLLWSITHSWLHFTLLIVWYKRSLISYKSCFKSRYNRNTLMHDTKNNIYIFCCHSPHASFLNPMHLDHLLVPIVFTNLCYHSKHTAYDVFPNQFIQLIANWIPYKNYCLGSNLKHGSQTNPTILVINDQIWSLFSTKKNGNMNLHTFLNLDNKQQKMNSPKFGSWGWLPKSKYYF